MVRLAIVLVCLAGLSGAANAALSPIITAAIDNMLTTVLSMWKLLLTAGVAIWVATAIANRFAPEKVLRKNVDQPDRWDTYTWSDGGHKFKVRKTGGGRSFDAVDDVGTGHRTYTFRD